MGQVLERVIYLTTVLLGVDIGQPVAAAGVATSIARAPASRSTLPCKAVTETIISTGLHVHACLLWKASGTTYKISKDIRIAYKHVTVTWSYLCHALPDGAVLDVGMLGIGKSLRQQHSYFLSQGRQAGEAGSGQARRSVRKYVMINMIVTPMIQESGLTTACTWHVRTTGDNV